MSQLKQWIVTVVLAGIIAAVGAIVVVARDDGSSNDPVPADATLAPFGNDTQQQPLEVPQDGLEQDPLQPQQNPTLLPTAVFQPTPTPPTTVTHIVQSGEFLASIANQYGVTVDEILELNNITDPNRIDVGQEILIPNQ